MKKRVTDFLFPGLNKDHIWKLFLLCIFLFHLWTFFLVFRDVPWVIDRFDQWDAVGLVSYALMFALIESFGVFLFFLVINALIPNRFEPKQRLSILSLMLFMIWIWGVLGQIYFLAEAKVNLAFSSLLAPTGRPLFFLYIILIPLVAGSTFLPLYALVKKPQRAVRIVDILDRISTLSILYLVLDVVGIFIVLYRNIF